MKFLSKILLLVIPGVIILALFMTNLSQESLTEENYQIGLSGIKKQYTIGDEIVFSLFLTGYGNECGSYEILLMKDTIPIERKSIDIDCSEKIDKDFEIINFDIITLELILLEAGDYTAIGEFTKVDGQKFQELKILKVE